MTDYEQQVEVGTEIIRAELARIADDLSVPRLLGLKFMVTDRDFDFERVSLVDAERSKIVTKIERDDLADSVADEVVRHRMTCRLEAAVRSYLAT